MAPTRKAVSRLRRSIEINRTFPLAHFFLAAALANLGKLDEARAGASVGLTYSIRLSQSSVSRGHESDNPIFSWQGRSRSSKEHAQGRPAERISETWKIAAILATDGVGYSRLMGEDEARTALSTSGARQPVR